MIIDSHAHAFPIPPLPDALRSRLELPLTLIRNQARQLLGPLHHEVHKAQTMMRHLPDPVRDTLDQLSGILPAGSLFVESTPKDLLGEMTRANVDRALLIAQEPFIPNEFVLTFAQENPERISPVVNIPKTAQDPASLLKQYHQRGAIALKLHPAADGDSVVCPRYQTLLRCADELGFPVIIHTGCIHSRVLYRDPEQGHAQHFVHWYRSYPHLRFVLAHMNFHVPKTAVDLMEEFENLYTDTSWQPAEAIAEAVRRLGADRILFGTDWPFVGNNFQVGLDRIKDCVDSGFISQEQADAILGINASRLFALEGHAT